MFLIKINKIIFCFSCIWVLITSSIYAQLSEEKIWIGKKVVLNSKIMNEERQVYIGLPSVYNYSSESYPVLYILDGSFSFLYATSITRYLAQTGKTPPMIVVAIPNTDRTRDLTPSEVDGSGNFGGTPRFLDFIKDELIPYIEQNYRTAPYRILSGHSLGGMFAIYAFITKPNVFKSYIVVSPAIHFDNEYTIKLAEKLLDKKMTKNKIMFITLGNEPSYLESLDHFTALLKKVSNNEFRWDYIKIENESHGSVPLQSLYKGMEFIYDGWFLSINDRLKGLKFIEKHYSKLSERYGYNITIPEYILNELGHDYMDVGKLKEAVEVFQENTRRYPDSANAYDSLGEGYEEIGNLELALENYKKAIEMGTEQQVSGLPVYQFHLQVIEKKLAQKYVNQ